MIDKQAADIVLAVINAKWIHPSLALRLLKANLGKFSSRCRILEFALRQNQQEMIDNILAASPRILGFSVSIWNHKATLDLLKILEKKWILKTGTGSGQPVRESVISRPCVVLGGPEVSWLPGNSEIFGYVDYVICGEGEEAFRELCRKILEPAGKAAPGDLPCMVHENLQEAGCKIAQFIKPRQVNLAALASPYDLYTDDDLCKRLIYAESSRGCIFNCDFCLSAAESPREFPLEIFLADMDKLLGRIAVCANTACTQTAQELSGRGSVQKRTVKLLDRSLNANPKRASAIMAFFLDRIVNGKINICVHFEMVPFNFTPELKNILCLFPPGSLRLELGIQTLNPAAASVINRAGDAETALENLVFLREKTNAIVHADLIAGLPGEDLQSFAQGFDRLWTAMTGCKVRTGECAAVSMEIQPGILKLLPGSPMQRHSVHYGMIYSKEPPYEVMETSAVPPAEMDRLKNFARFWEILVNRNHFPDQISVLVPAGEPVFWRFMDLADRLLAKFGRNWGIAREELRDAL